MHYNSLLLVTNVINSVRKNWNCKIRFQAQSTIPGTIK
jgi:hypothetical protein